MKYGSNNEKVITGIKRISKPGLRVYAKRKNFLDVLGGLGIAVISTSKGVMSDKQARKEGLGGEVIIRLVIVAMGGRNNVTYPVECLSRSLQALLLHMITII